MSFAGFDCYAFFVVAFSSISFAFRNRSISVSRSTSSNFRVRLLRLWRLRLSNESSLLLDEKECLRELKMPIFTIDVLKKGAENIYLEYSRSRRDLCFLLLCFRRGDLLLVRDLPIVM